MQSVNEIYMITSAEEETTTCVCDPSVELWMISRLCVPQQPPSRQEYEISEWIHELTCVAREAWRRRREEAEPETTFGSSVLLGMPHELKKWQDVGVAVC